MAKIKPFCAVRSTRDIVSLVSSRSFENYGPKELAAQLDFNPFTFLHIISSGYKKKELPNEERFSLIKEKYNEFKNLGYFSQDKKEAFYIYKKITDYGSSIGIIAANSVDDYANTIIKKHEDTLEKREVLFGNYLKSIRFNAEPVLLTYPDNTKIATILNSYQNKRAEYEFTTKSRSSHLLWLLEDKNEINIIQEEFKKMNAIYIADGHHRTASSYRMAQILKEENPNHTGNEAYNYFMSYLIPESDLQIFEFNRLVKDLNGLSENEFIDRLSKLYTIEKKGVKKYIPSKKHHFSMYLDGEYYSLYLKKEEFEINNPLSDLDPQLLFKTILEPILGISDLKNDKRLHYINEQTVGLTNKASVDSGKYKVAFGLYPVSIKQLKAVADAGLTMPPKSTYILPKLRSGFTIYEF